MTRIPLIGELHDNDEPRLTPEEQEVERRRQREEYWRGKGEVLGRALARNGKAPAE